jgi:hypothetical protein
MERFALTVVLRSSTERNGYSIEHLAEINAKSVTATKDETRKLEFQNGKLAVDFLSGSYLYGSEIQLSYYTRDKPTERSRVQAHNGYYRVEIHLSLDEAAKLIKAIR